MLGSPSDQQSVDDIDNRLFQHFPSSEEEKEEEKPTPCCTRVYSAVGKFTINSIFCGSLGGFGFNSLLLYANDPLTYGATVWDITQNVYLSPFLLINRGMEYTANMTTMLLVEKPASCLDFKYLIADNAPAAVKHVAIDMGLLTLAVWLYMSQVEFPDLLELCLLNSMITLARNIIEFPLDAMFEKVLRMEALQGLRNYNFFALPDRQRAARRNQGNPAQLVDPDQPTVQLSDSRGRGAYARYV